MHWSYMGTWPARTCPIFYHDYLDYNIIINGFKKSMTHTVRFVPYISYEHIPSCHLVLIKCYLSGFNSFKHALSSFKVAKYFEHRAKAQAKAWGSVPQVI